MSRRGFGTCTFVLVSGNLVVLDVLDFRLICCSVHPWMMYICPADTCRDRVSLFRPNGDLPYLFLMSQQHASTLIRAWTMILSRCSIFNFTGCMRWSSRVWTNARLVLLLQTSSYLPGRYQHLISVPLDYKPMIISFHARSMKWHSRHTAGADVNGHLHMSFSTSNVLLIYRYLIIYPSVTSVCPFSINNLFVANLHNLDPSRCASRLSFPHALLWLTIFSGAYNAARRRFPLFLSSSLCFCVVGIGRHTWAEHF